MGICDRSVVKPSGPVTDVFAASDPRGLRGIMRRRGEDRSRDDAGGVAAEYAAMTAFIAGAIVVMVNAFGTRVTALIELL